jgi:uncharacterized LabA/DUF88 family protein
MWKIHQQKPDLFGWLDKVREHGPLAFGRAYGDFSQPVIQALESDLRALGIDKFDCPVKQSGQSTVDSNIIIDLYEVALDQPNVKTFVLMAGDSDYIRVVAKLRQRMDKDIVVMGVQGSISRDLVKAAGREVLLEPIAIAPIDEGKLIRLIDQYEATRRPGALPTFRFLSQYLSDPRNAAVIPSQTIGAKLNELVARNLLVQSIVPVEDGREVRVTKLDREHPEVTAALT